MQGHVKTPTLESRVELHLEEETSILIFALRLLLNFFQTFTNKVNKNT